LCHEPIVAAGRTGAETVRHATRCRLLGDRCGRRGRRWPSRHRSAPAFPSFHPARPSQAQAPGAPGASGKSIERSRARDRRRLRSVREVV
jgi:hypothetical protein